MNLPPPPISRAKSLIFKTLLIISIVSAFSFIILADKGFLVKTQINTDIDHKAERLFITREGMERPLFYKGESGIFPSSIKLKQGDFIGCIEDSLYAHYDTESVMYVQDGMYFYNLPTHYNRPVENPAGPLLNISSYPAGSFAVVGPATGFLCLEYSPSLSTMFDRLVIGTDSVPIAGNMYYDGDQLIPMGEQPTEVTVDFSNSKKTVIPVPPGIDLSYNIVARNTKNGASKEFKVEDNIERGRISCHRIYNVKSPQDSIPENTDTVIPEKPVEIDTVPVPGFIIIPEERREKDDRKEKDKDEEKEENQCRAYVPKDLKDFLISTYDELKRMQGIDTRNFENWATGEPLGKWKNVRDESDGFGVKITPDKMREFAFMLVLDRLKDCGLTEKSEKYISTLNGPNKPECEVKPKVGTVMKIERCDTLKDLTLSSLNYERLEIRNCKRLQKLVLIDCSFEEVRIECCPNLNIVYAPLNRIEDLKIKNCPEITALDVSCNRLKNIYLRNLPDLKYLNCAINNIQTLDLRANKFLETLICGYNDLSELYIPYPERLKQLSTLGNGLLKIYPSIFELKKSGLKMYNTDGKIEIVK